ncbi:tetratricopeptide repeat protein [Tateyamaria sp. SN6-1]|uniref:tetratricopeptide repeat protein n=1 Tax=Tateyamaria sp. SN6-1 TaxID=3092148 RepID=UPI0039F5D5C5
MKPLIFAAAVLALLSTGAHARPILSDSQKSYALVCLENREPAERMAAICEVAVADAGVGPVDLRNIKVVLADAYDALGRTEHALSLLDDVLAQAPAHTKALNSLGWVHWSQDNFEAAVAAFDRSVDSGATAQGLAGLASARRLAGTIDEDTYIQLIDAAIAMSPEYTWAMREKAWFLIDKGQFVAAEQPLWAAMEVDDADPWTLYALGLALFRQDKYYPALAQLNEAIATGDAPTVAYLFRARAHFSVENYRAAMVDAERITQDWPEDPDGPVWKARSLAALGLRPAGITVLRTYLQDAESGFASYWLASLLHDADEVDAAIDILRQNMESDAADYYDHELMALLRFENDQHAQARVHIAAALALDPDAQYPLYYEALIEVSDRNYEDAEALFLDALAKGLPRRHIQGFIGALTEAGALDRAGAFRRKADAVVSDN